MKDPYTMKLKQGDLYYYISGNGEILFDRWPKNPIWYEADDRYVIGNVFKTEKEAEDALYQLKALQELKDRGFMDLITPEMRETTDLEGNHLSRFFVVEIPDEAGEILEKVKQEIAREREL